MADSAVTYRALKGGEFLLVSVDPGEVFTPAHLTEDQRLIGQTAEEFVKREVLPHVPELEEHRPGLMPELLRRAGAIGLLGGGIPEEYGGTGLDRVSATLLAEKLAAYASFAVSHGGHAGIGTLPIVYFGTEEQKRRYLPRLATGELLSCYCLSEPHAGSDALAARTRADLSPDGAHWILNGQKMWITNGGFADVFIVFARVGGEQFSCFIVERGTPGLSVGPEEKKMGIRGSSTVPVFFENARIPRENLLYEIGRGHVVAFNILNYGRFSLAAYCLGGAKYILEAAARYARERTAFGRPISEFGLIRTKLGEMAARIYAVESLIYRTAGMMDAARAALESSPAGTMKVLEEYAIECSIAKVLASEMLDAVVDEAVQIYGGYGFHEDYPVARAYRDSRINRIFEGTNEINRLVIVQMLMKRAMAGTLPLVPAALRVADAVLAGPVEPEPAPGPLGPERLLVEQVKKIFLLAAGTAVERFREALADQQEIVGALADLVMEIYAMESALLRAEQAAQRGQAPPAGLEAAARVFLHEAADRVEQQARMAIVASTAGDDRRTRLALLRRLARREPADVVALRREVAQAVVSGERYPFEGH